MAKEVITIRISRSQKRLLEHMSETYSTSIDALIGEAVYEYFSDERKRMERRLRMEMEDE